MYINKGTTTMAGRYKKMKPMPFLGTDRTNVNTSTNVSTIKNEILDKTEKIENEKNDIVGAEKIYVRKTNNVLNIITAGQCLIRTKFYKIFNDKVIYEFYNDNIKRRIAYETLEKELQQGEYIHEYLCTCK
jgi:hypothetical protein